MAAEEAPLLRVAATELPCAVEKEVRFDVRPRDVVWLKGPSGVGKSTICSRIALQRNDDRIIVDWRPDVPVSERCGALFQETTLVDSLCLGANVLLALQQEDGRRRNDDAAKAKALVEAVGLSWHRDALKMPTELSGGMARRGAIALQLASRKRVVVLDEPFTGLPIDTAREVATELRQHLVDAALVVVSHRPELVTLLNKNGATKEVDLSPREDESSEPDGRASLLEAGRFWRRFHQKLADYLVYSAPLILLAFAAAGLAVSAVSADLLSRLDASPLVDRLVETEVLPLVDLLLKNKDNPLEATMAKAFVRSKARSLADGAFPPAKRAVYARGIAALFVLELGPLLAGLLFAGRIGGAFAGEVATMQATRQNDLLRTLGVDARRWSLYPALLAALVAVPVLAAAGTLEALYIASVVGRRRLSDSWFWPRVRGAVLPGLASRVSGASSLNSALLRLATWPPAFHLLKTLSYVLILLAAAELAARRPRLSPRDVPGAVTAAVVFGSLAIILLDFLFSQLLILDDSPADASSSL
ncbi:hypothetical protein CTAYLR_010609 [Chrysophaeum taylorii]|uniref:ABC transporter domain-containing protein n=1 Tax=Chrysophaeum taylorii TaxID=2483200 RepID=A0AAD7XML0_9STRA|nr:hypothetical protein CTAYLR_010609 [Chrysophaeum taylorii]